MKHASLVVGFAFIAVALGTIVSCSDSTDDCENCSGDAAVGGGGGSNTGGSKATGGTGGGTATGGSGGGSATGGSGGGTATGGSGGGTATGGSSTGGSASDDFGQLCVDKINAYRATLSLTPYTRWEGGEVCANGEAKSDTESGTAHGAFGSCGEFAQNECPGWPGPVESMIGNCLDMMWAEGPGSDFNQHGHYINMSSTQYTEAACGYYALPNGDVWAVQNFR